MKSLLAVLLFIISIQPLSAQQPVPVKPRVLISTDIGGTDPDDNQSMAHLLMYNDKFDIEGLVSSPSYGSGRKEEILRMIDLYEKDWPKLQRHQQGFLSPDYLRSITKQGRRGSASYSGVSTATEGSEWIIKCAKKPSKQPLWMLVWGGLEDLAQALHNAPEIQNKIKVYWIGGPNKKWSANSYAYIAANFPKLWFIEVNSSYYGFFSNNTELDSVNASDYYDKHIAGAGYLGKDFKNYYNGDIKMGDTPSLLYLMDGDPNNPSRESWGGSFEKTRYSSRAVYDRPTTLKDSVAFCTVVEFHFKGPQLDIPADSICFRMITPYKNGAQEWPGYYLGNGNYSIKYAPKQAEILSYYFKSEIPGLNMKEGKLVITNRWPGTPRTTDYPLGDNWYTDKSNPRLYDGKIQGGKTIAKWRADVLADWAKRWNWLRE
ncbi:nucleoside hydrolase-like domain-containing protein [Pedobacter sp. SYSU D00535]|uniref:nucleoside hydrolase-like domain-containing protein n=1 Tax=Pedobacter sp. SYSU D00535 TaxID=2810308 RepID=UPI001F617C47|nr:nucleoside hydrolase-like domain-containing protein [Pedobacter sp. SYSU D00535]